MSQALQDLTNGDWDTLRSIISKISSTLRQPLPQVKVSHNAAQAIANNTTTVLTFNTDVYNAGNMHSTSTNPTRLTAKITGLYSVGAAVEFPANATGYREIALIQNGTIFVARNRAVPSGAVAWSGMAATEVHLNAGEYIECAVVQTSGGSLSVAAFTATLMYSPMFWMHRIGGYTNEGIA